MDYDFKKVEMLYRSPSENAVPREVRIVKFFGVYICGLHFEAKISKDFNLKELDWSDLRDFLANAKPTEELELARELEAVAETVKAITGHEPELYDYYRDC